MKIAFDERESKQAALPMVRVSTGFKQQLATYAERNGVSISVLIRAILERAIAEGIEIE
jgi:hypothetical protein